MRLANTKAPASKSGSAKPAAGTAKKPAKKPAQKNAGGRKPAGNQKPAAGNRRGGNPAQDPVRGREIKLFICFALALFAAIGCFTGEGVFIAFFKKLMLGIVGRGFYALPFILVGCGLQYGLVRDKPLVGRVLCTLLLSVVIGAFCQLFGYGGAPLLKGGLLKQLWENGRFGGGAVGGLIAWAFKGLFNKVGATIILVLLTVFLLMMSVGETMVSVVGRVRERKRRKAEEWELYQQRREAELEEKRIAAEEARQRQEAEAEKAARPSRRKVVDFPLDDVKPVSPALQGEFFDKKTETGNDPAVEKKTEPKKSAVKQEEVPKRDLDWLSAIITKDPLQDESGERTPPAASAKSREPRKAPEPTKAAAAPRVSEAPKPAPSPKPAEPVKPDTEPPKPAFEPQISPQTLSPDAEAVLADDKAAKAALKAETLQAKAEMIEDIEESMKAEAQEEKPEYIYPSVTLLNSAPPENRGKNTEELSETAGLLSATIQSFGIPAKICDLTRGPTVTRYEVELDKGVKLNRLTGLADDIALALGVGGVRIAPIPDKSSIVGIEVPNRTTTTVYLRDIIDTKEFRERSSPLAFAVGKDIGGNPVVGDIDRLTHLLIAGTTGSGKSVCMNSLILSLLYKSGPEQVRLIMVDPKMIELGIYNGIPHLLIPVVTDPKKAAGALQWAVVEMLRRYRTIADSGTRDLNSYNRYAEEHSAEGVQTMPRLVILIDELADLMLVAAKDVEESICRIAQMGRAAGIHIVIATQRPSADVITGLMKANIPSRIAFAVDSALNSRIILDAAGAEKLLGKGDMLYSPIGVGKPVRVQGTFVTDGEREDVVNFVKSQGPENYSSEVQNEIERSVDKGKDKPRAEESEDESEDSELDELYEEAVDIVVESKQASVSMLQRRLKLGYTRAARIVDQMEERGVVGAFEGSKPRAVLVTKQQWDEMRGRAEPAPEPEGEPAAEEPQEE